MSVRSLGYDSEDLDRIICYFMRMVLQLQKFGVENLPLKNTLVEPYKTFLDTAIGVFLDSPDPELARLILEAEYDATISHGQVSTETALGLQLIKEFTWHIHYDEDYYNYLLSTENIWGNTAIEYASLTFYPNLPEEIKCKHHIHDLIAIIPEKMFRLDDY
mgnify:FL=1